GKRRRWERHVVRDVTRGRDPDRLHHRDRTGSRRIGGPLGEQTVVDATASAVDRVENVLSQRVGYRLPVVGKALARDAIALRREPVEPVLARAKECDGAIRGDRDVVEKGKER